MFFFGYKSNNVNQYESLEVTYLSSVLYAIFVVI